MKHTGYFRDASTGLDYADQRYEQPGVGRFMSPDPAGSSANASDPGSWNRYAYVGGDPANGTDPSGLNADFENGYGGGFSFYLDGLQVGGGMFGGLMDMGAAAICPNNACSGFVSDSSGTTLVQFQSEAGAGPTGYIGLADTVATPTSSEVTAQQIAGIGEQVTYRLRQLNVDEATINKLLQILQPGQTVGGHLNLTVSFNDLSQLIGSDNASALTTGWPNGDRAGGFLNLFDSLHSQQKADGNVSFHVDTFNAGSYIPIGFFGHVMFDVGLGTLVDFAGGCIDQACQN